MSKIKHETLKTPLYGNCRVENIEGVHIFNASYKKCSWYLRKDLAQVIQEEPLIIRLKFVTKKDGNLNDPFYLQERKNICVACGTDSHLTRHHVVPLMYRRYFENELKDHTSHDVVPLCYTCHKDYELASDQLKAELRAELNVERMGNTAFNRTNKIVCSAASAIMKYGEAIPKERYEKMMATIRSYYERDVTAEDIEKAAELRYNTQRTNYISEGQLVVEAIDDIETFVRRWRTHFIETLKPQYMPQHWSVDRPLRS